LWQSEKGKMYKSVICHIHSTFEGPASIEGYCYEAARLGIDAIWLADHDSRIPDISGNAPQLFTTYDFKNGTEYVFSVVDNEGAKSKKAVWTVTDESSLADWSIEENKEGGYITLRSSTYNSEWQGVSIYLTVSAKADRRAVISEPVINLDLDSNIIPGEKNARVIIRVYLSQVPPEHKQVFIDYVIGEPNESKYMIPVKPEENRISLNIAEDVKHFGLGLDNTVTRLEVRVESRGNKQATVSLKKMEIETKIMDREYLLEKQKQIGKEIGKRYGIEVLSGYEISEAEFHLTCFGDNVPIYPYKYPERPLAEEMNRHVSNYGGITSINHPFSKWKREVFDESQKPIMVEKRAAEIIERKGYGSKLIEVGFPEGRNDFSLEHHLRLWDLVNLAGLRLAGIGVSDAHSNISWESGNNFANYIQSPDCKVANLLAGMKKGNFYMADPYRCKGNLRIATNEGKTMGDVQKGGFVTIELKQITERLKLVWIADGENVKEEIVEGDHISQLNLEKIEHFVRAEIWDVDGRLVLLTNPIWVG
jgi:hypothetical protein